MRRDKKVILLQLTRIALSSNFPIFSDPTNRLNGVPHVSVLGRSGVAVAYNNPMIEFVDGDGRLKDKIELGMGLKSNN